MDSCTVEVGLLRKKPCGEKAVTRCTNCEQPLCSKHAVAQLSAAGGHTGTFMCAECDVTNKKYLKAQAEQKAGQPARPGAPRAAPAAAPAAKPAPAAAKPAPAAKKPEPAVENSGPLEFTPEPKKPAEKK